MHQLEEPQPLPSIHRSSVITCNIDIPDSTHIEPYCVITAGEKASIKIGDRTTFYPGVIIRSSVGDISIGDDVSFGPSVVIYEVRGGLRIGRNTMIGAGVRICGTSHGTEAGSPMRSQAARSQHIDIGEDVWIGMNTVIHPGVSIGSGTIIGSGSVVTKSIPSMSVAFGCPCKVKRSRK